ncbi:DUF938 domain-containing protein [Ferrimonas gelatinilytica]|uniref:Class I SAM-dependent methyltransferase n=1 Tax=Ferrimonas gelatinilytica TaxID=1255257 RepID=A0ABP9S065_9GAMM
MPAKSEPGPAGRPEEVSLPYSPACDSNKGPILSVLRQAFCSVSRVLEIASGTGQHGAYFAAELPHLTWQMSDLPSHQDHLLLRQRRSGCDNLLAPRVLNVESIPWDRFEVDAVFSANSCHILSWPQVEQMVAGVGRLLRAGEPFCLYGPFHDAGRATSLSNAQFDLQLRSRDPAMGLRDYQSLVALAWEHNLTLQQRHEMPANNLLLEFRHL